MFRIVGFGLSFCQNAAPLLLIELSYPTQVGFWKWLWYMWADFFFPQRGKFTAIFNSCWYLGSIISAWVIIWLHLSKIMPSLIVVSRSAMAPTYKQVTLCGRGVYPQFCRPFSQPFKSYHCGSYLSLLGGWFLQAGYKTVLMPSIYSTPSNNCLGKQSGCYSCQIPCQYQRWAWPAGYVWNGSDPTCD